MFTALLSLVFRLLARVPLPILHGFANALGRIAYHVLPRTRQRIMTHLQTADIIADKPMVQAIFQETIKSGLELPIAFYRSPQHISSLFVEIQGKQHLDTAIQQGKGLLLLTPHLGSYDLAGRFLSEQLPFPLTALYKPPKIKALDKIMQRGRQRDNGRTATTDRQGVKRIIQALRHGEATIVLPDHVPNPHEGKGVWADFLGQAAYTATLTGKLAQVKNVQTLFFVGERLENGKGFVLHIQPFNDELTGDAVHDATCINQHLAYWIRRFPQQYLFAYNRYKHPAGAPERPTSAVQ